MTFKLFFDIKIFLKGLSKNGFNPLFKSFMKIKIRKIKRFIKKHWHFIVVILLSVLCCFKAGFVFGAEDEDSGGETVTCAETSIDSFRFAGAQIPYLRLDLLAAGFLFPDAAADHRCSRTVFLYCIGRSSVVWICLPANSVDADIPLV